MRRGSRRARHALVVGGVIALLAGGCGGAEGLAGDASDRRVAPDPLPAHPAGDPSDDGGAPSSDASPDGVAADTDADDGGGADPPLVDAGPDLVPPDYRPSPANLGWIGGACRTAADCAYDGALCLLDAPGLPFGVPNGLCTLGCDGTCPDRTQAGDTETFCVDARPFGRPLGASGPLDEGLCVSRCDPSVLGATGCAEGYACVPRNRYGDPRTVVEVCLPAVPPAGCAAGADDEIVDLDYPDRGKVVIPREARCGGRFDLVVMLHGINPDSNPTPSLGGGRHLELEVRALVDAGLLRPLVLAEPVDFEGTSTTLYGAAFDPATHLDRVLGILGPRGITLGSLSYTGHSGAGCDPDNGLYKVLAELDTLVPAYAPDLRLWGLEDVCYEESYHWTVPEQVLGNRPTVLFNVYSVQGNPDAFEANLFPGAVPLDCDTALYTSCIAHPSRPWSSYRTRATAGIGHDNNPYFFVREALPQVFSP